MLFNKRLSGLTMSCALLLIACTNGTNKNKASNTSDSAGCPPHDVSNVICYQFPAISKAVFSGFQPEFYRSVENDSLEPNGAAMIASYGPDTGRVIAECVLPYNVIDSKASGVNFITILGATEDGQISKCDYDDPKTKSFPYSPNFLVQRGAYENEPGADHHMLVIDTGAKKLYETYQLRNKCNDVWIHNGAAMFDLTDTAPRVNHYHGSADAAGLPILPLLIRWDEVKSRTINHALRITLLTTKDEYVRPATHWAYHNTIGAIPMGARLRLRKDFDDSGYSDDMKVIIQCLKTYGAIVADNGTAFTLAATNDCRFNNFPKFDPDRNSPSFWLAHCIDYETNHVRPRDFQVIKIKNPIHDNTERCDSNNINQPIICKQNRR